MNLLQKYRAELILEREGQSKLFSSVLRIGDKIFWFFSGLAASAVMFGFYLEELIPNSNSGVGGWAVYISIIAAILLVVIGGAARSTLNLFFFRIGAKVMADASTIPNEAETRARFVMPDLIRHPPFLSPLSVKAAGPRIKSGVTGV